MAKGLLISDQHLLNDIYTINFQVYVGLEVELETTLRGGLDYLRAHHKELDVIVILSRVEEIDCGERVVELMGVESIRLPVVMIGEQSSVANRTTIHTLPANLNIKALLRTLATVLGVTAKEMAEKSTHELYPIPIKLFQNLDMAICDVFLKATKSEADEQYVQVLKRGDLLDKRMEGHIAQGIKTLFVPAESRLSMVNAASSSVIKKLSEVDPGNVGSAVDVLEQGHDLVALQVSQGEGINEDIVSLSKQCVGIMSEVAHQVPKLKNLIHDMLSNKVNYLYMHTVLASYVSKHILERVEWGSNEHIEKVQFVLFFHDIYLAPIYSKYPDLKFEEDLLFMGTLDYEEKELVVSHAAMAAKMVREFPKAPLGADTLILQHHGMTTGEGFAIEFRDDVSPLAKIVSISEEFVNQLLKQQDEQDGSYDVPAIIEFLEARFTRHSYRRIVELLKDISI